MATKEVDPLEARALKVAENTPAMLAEHAKVTGGKIRTRFPPEPNGYLHIGHAKSMNMNFSEAFEKLGVPPEQRETYFRYDDTNPTAESQEYIQALNANVQWLGHKPAKTTYSSEYFQELYELALKLIKKGYGYVCHQSKAEIEASRAVLRAFHGVPGEKKAEDVPKEAHSPYRNRSVEENLREFEKMRVGFYDEGAACLRMKMDLASPNPNMWDQVAYRIKYVPHPHIGATWCIYPTYDYTHCIVDALEHIDYSICTLEFETRRESYYWLLDVLDLYKPKVYEFARLDMTYTQMSKRKLLKMVMSGSLRGWDDPRLPTLVGLKRRGLTAEIINRFCKEIGVTRVQSMIQIERLYSVARDVLGEQAKRVMGVLDPVEVVIENYDEAPEALLSCEVPDYPQDPERDGAPKHHVALTKTVYVDRSDVHAEDSSDFYGLAPNKQVRLKYAINVTCTKIDTDKNGRVTRVHGVADWSNENKPKGILTWVPAKSPFVEVRVYSHLFTVPNLNNVDDWESVLDLKHSEVVYKHARIDPESFERNVQPSAVAVQFERVGYFVKDKDATAKHCVLNQVVSLREASSLNEAKPKHDATASRKAEQMAQLAAKKEKMKIPPQELFTSQTELYSKFDAEGLPTHDAAGEALTKSATKKLKKEQDKQKRLYEQYLKESAAEATTEASA